MSNLSKLKREKLIEKLNVIRESYIDDDDMRKVLNTIEAELTSKRYFKTLGQNKYSYEKSSDI